MKKMTMQNVAPRYTGSSFCTAYTVYTVYKVWYTVWYTVRYTGSAFCTAVYTVYTVPAAHAQTQRRKTHAQT